MSQLVTACKQYCLAAGATQGNIAYAQNVTPIAIANDSSLYPNIASYFPASHMPTPSSRQRSTTKTPLYSAICAFQQS